MKLTLEWADAYARLTAPPYLEAEAREARRERIRAALAEPDPEALEIQRVAPASGDEDALSAALYAAPWFEDAWVLHLWWADEGAAHEALDALLGELFEELEARGQAPGRIMTRLDHGRCTGALREVLRARGFAEDGERHEFRTPVEALPPEREGSPLRWRDLEQVGLDEAAAVFGRAGQGPDWDDEDDPRALIQGYLAEEGMTSSPRCVQIGFEGQAPVAFVVAQTEESSGWSTVTFMGLVPEARGRGLGVDVHRRGFAMLREQGAQIYHGGTSAQNAPMLALFRAHGCAPFVHFEEWAWRPTPT